MYSIDELRAEISAKIEWLQENNGTVLHPDAITDQIMSDHADINGDDVGFYVCCSRAMVRDQVRRSLNRFDATAIQETIDPQIVMVGFERLQTYYLITRQKERVAVRVDQMTEEEIRGKIAEMLAHIDGMSLHVRELKRYMERRFGSQVA